MCFPSFASIETMYKKMKVRCSAVRSSMLPLAAVLLKRKIPELSLILMRRTRKVVYISSLRTVYKNMRKKESNKSKMQKTNIEGVVRPVSQT